jgi:hypothetical protein
MTSPPGRALVVVLGRGSPSPARIVRAAGDRPVVFACGADAIPASTVALAESLAPVVPVPAGLPLGAVPALATHRPAGITTFSEPALPVTQVLADALGLPYHSASTVTALTDKSCQRARLAAAGVDATRSATVRGRAELDAALTGPPFVVKPLRGEGSIDTYLARTPDDVPAGLAVGPERPFLVEEFLAGRDERPFGDYVSVETLTASGHTHVLGVTGKLALLPPFREVGQFAPSRLGSDEDWAVAGLAVRALAALGVTRGLAHTEIKLTPAGPRLIEVNGRLGGHIEELYGRTLGLDLLALELAVAAGDKPVLDLRPPERVHYQYTNLPPIDGGTLLAVAGAAAVRAQPGIVSYRAMTPRGSVLPTGVATVELDLLAGEAADHAALLADVDAALARLRFTFADADGVSRVWQADRTGLRCLG